MDIFLICPVRHVSPDFKARLDKHVRSLEVRGARVYYPLRDTNQDDATGLRICKNNRWAMSRADIVQFTWDGKSQGCIFDLGMAFDMCKKIEPVRGLVPIDNGFEKSIVRMVLDWSMHGAD